MGSEGEFQLYKWMSRTMTNSSMLSLSQTEYPNNTEMKYTLDTLRSFKYIKPFVRKLIMKTYEYIHS